MSPAFAVELDRQPFRRIDTETKPALRIGDLYHWASLAKQCPCLVSVTFTRKLDDFGTDLRACEVHTDALPTLLVHESIFSSLPLDSPALVGVVITLEPSELCLVFALRTLYIDAVDGVLRCERHYRPGRQRLRLSGGDST